MAPHISKTKRFKLHTSLQEKLLWFWCLDHSVYVVQFWRCHLLCLFYFSKSLVLKYYFYAFVSLRGNVDFMFFIYFSDHNCILLINFLLFSLLINFTTLFLAVCNPFSVLYIFFATSSNRQLSYIFLDMQFTFLRLRHEHFFFFMEALLGTFPFFLPPLWCQCSLIVCAYISLIGLKLFLCGCNTRCCVMFGACVCCSSTPAGGSGLKVV